MQLRKSQSIRVRHDQRVCVRDIHARFDNRGADQNVYLAFQHLLPDFLQLVLFHLPVRNGNARLRDRLRHLRRNAVDRLHIVVQVEHLPAAPQLPPHGFLQNQRILLQHIGLYGQTVHGCVIED